VKYIATYAERRRASGDGDSGINLDTDGTSSERVGVARILLLPEPPDPVNHLKNTKISTMPLTKPSTEAYSMMEEEHRIYKVNKV